MGWTRRCWGGAFILAVWTANWLNESEGERTIGSAIEVHTAGGRGGGVSLSVR